MKFTYVQLGLTRLVDDDGREHPIPGNWIYRVDIGSGPSQGRVLGMVQENPSVKNVWVAVAVRNGVLPAVDYRQGLWPLKPGRNGFGSKREAAVWLLGVSDARQSWFDEEDRS